MIPLAGQLATAPISSLMGQLAPLCTPNPSPLKQGIAKANSRIIL